MMDRQYLKELFAGIGGYLILLFGSVWSLRTMQPTGAMQVAILLLPMSGLCVVAWAIVRALFRMDEMQQRIQFQALAFAVACTSLVTLGWGFLETVGYPKFPTFGVWPLVAASWMAGNFVIRRRYR